jgi:ADP-ribose pyrophosphatase YjhB (NUDIX family)
MEGLWLAWAKRLQSIAATGLHFGRGQYDKERYEEIAAIANRMLAELGNVPISRIEDLVPDFAQGYATPKVEVRGAVFERDKILLVQEKSDRLWTLPGGYADVGISPAENVVKEIREEAGLHVEAQALYGLRHKAKHGYDADARDFYKLFFLCEPTRDGRPEPGLETAAAAFFALDELPPLSTGRVLEQDIVAAYAFRRDPSRPAAFD